MFAIAVLSAMVYGGRMREAKVFFRRTPRGSFCPRGQSFSRRRAAGPRRTEPRENVQMRAMVLRKGGGLEKLFFDSNFPDPEIGPADFLLRVRATSLNYHDISPRRGMPG